MYTFVYTYIRIKGDKDEERKKGDLYRIVRMMQSFFSHKVKEKGPRIIRQYVYAGDEKN